MSTLNSKVKVAIGQPVKPKTDDQDRLWREMRCLHCRYWFGDEFIRDGRIRLKCPKCSKITVMEVKPRKKVENGRSPSKKLTQETTKHE